MENLRKMLLAMAKDIRVILIKICDRLHNMRTMQYQIPEQAAGKGPGDHGDLRPAWPTAWVCSASSGSWRTCPSSTSTRWATTTSKTQLDVPLLRPSGVSDQHSEAKLQKRMEDEGIHCTVYGRIKHIYSIYRKMYTQHKTLFEIFDLYAFRVIVDDIADCYNVLGLVHDMFNPVPGRFKDYISTPKPNMYQSLHTTVIGKEGIPFEVQIRTWEMHQTAEYGIAAHWKYKAGRGQREAGQRGHL